MFLMQQVIQLLVAGMPSATDDINNAIGFDKVLPQPHCVLLMLR
jgi:hypothetical protein